MHATAVFERHEIKYLLNAAQYAALLQDLSTHMQADQYSRHTICSLYYDTPGYDCARRQLEKCTFREKLRLRSYGVPQGGDTVYIEMKKKLAGVTYKRRMGLPLQQARAYLQCSVPPQSQGQVFGEVDWFVRQNQLQPKTLICYDRIALFGREDTALRITFDSDIRHRHSHLDLAKGDWGSPLCTQGQVLMEVKTASSLPIWLCGLLSHHGVFPASFSKFRASYQALLTQEVRRHAV